jgi:hypothetical protein
MKETEKMLNETGIMLSPEVLPLLILAGLPEKFKILVQMLETKTDLSVDEIEEHLDRHVSGSAEGDNPNTDECHY